MSDATHIMIDRTKNIVWINGQRVSLPWDKFKLSKTNGTLSLEFSYNELVEVK